MRRRYFILTSLSLSLSCHFLFPLRLYAASRVHGTSPGRPTRGRLFKAIYSIESELRSREARGFHGEISYFRSSALRVAVFCISAIKTGIRARGKAAENRRFANCASPASISPICLAQFDKRHITPAAPTPY